MTDILVIETEEETSIAVTFTGAVVIDTEIRVCDTDNVSDDPPVADNLAEVGVAVTIMDNDSLFGGNVGINVSIGVTNA